jgi:hypothetical protein
MRRLIGCWRNCGGSYERRTAIPRAPKSVPLVLCKRYHIDSQAGEQSLIGVFHSFRSGVFPFRAPDFTIYAALNGGDGEGRMVLEVMRLETGQVVFRFTKWYA